MIHPQKSNPRTVVLLWANGAVTLEEGVPLGAQSVETLIEEGARGYAIRHKLLTIDARDSVLGQARIFEQV